MSSLTYPPLMLCRFAGSSLRYPEAQRFDGMDNIGLGGSACDGDAATGEVGIDALGAGQTADGTYDAGTAVVTLHAGDDEGMHGRLLHVACAVAACRGGKECQRI